MSLIMIEASLFLPGSVSALDGLRAVKGVIEGLGQQLETGFVPYRQKYESLLREEDPKRIPPDGFRVVLNNESLARAFHKQSWLLSVSYLPSHPHIKEVRIYPYESTHGSELRRVWQIMLNGMPGIIDCTQPSLAFATGRPEEDEETDFIPPAEAIRPGELPPFLTPWNYIGPDHLSEERRTLLRQLPAVQSQSLRDGWLLRMVKDLSEQPSFELLQKLHTIPNPVPVGYMQSRISQS